MRLPVIATTNKYKKSMIAFGGLNLMQDFSEGEMRDCSGVSHINYPAITQRQRSEIDFLCSCPTAAGYSGQEFIAANDGLYCERKIVGTLSTEPKQLAFLGSKVLVFPDKIYYDTLTKTFGSLEGESILSGVSVTFSSDSISVPESAYVTEYAEEECTFPKGREIITYTSAEINDGVLTLEGFDLQKVEEIQEGCIFCENCNTSQYRIAGKITATSDEEHYTVENRCVSVVNIVENVFSEINEGDVVEISGCSTVKANNKRATVVSKKSNALVFAEGTFSAATETNAITVKRKIPDFVCVCSYENRLWGCEGNTIYASALGDPTNFFVYNNLSTDSFSVQSNTAGDFTACVAYGNCCLFFKENSCYKLYGTRPANFQLTESFAAGILKRDSRSLVNINGSIIYKGNGGVFAYYGGSSQRISQKLEGINLDNTVAGSDGKRYFISADTGTAREEFVWDMEKNLWSKSGVKDALGYAFYGGAMYRLIKDGIERIYEESDADAPWSVTFCPFDEGYYKTKDYSRLHIKARIFENSYICAEIKTDDEKWRTVNTSYGKKTHYINIPCVAKRCHEVQLRLSGKGKSIIESITREFSVN